jgi:hypothetical protein
MWSPEGDNVTISSDIARAPMATIAEAVTGNAAPEAWSVELEPQAEAAAGIL